jgi:hypothetical protein
MKNYLSLAISKLCPTAEFSFSDEDYSTIVWDKLDGQAPSIAEINTAIAAIKADEINAKAQTAIDKAALLDKLGITADEAALLLG